jgi:hypothetical protein
LPPAGQGQAMTDSEQYRVRQKVFCRQQGNEVAL